MHKFCVPIRSSSRLRGEPCWHELPRQKPSTFERAGVYIVARVNRDEQSYWVTTIDLPTALHPTLASTSRLSSLTKRAVFIFTSIVFTQRRIIRTTTILLDHGHT